MNNEFFNRKYLKTYRKELRNNPTKAESFLWMVLKGKKLDGKKFRRQQSIGNYIVDFYCASEKLIIELDGEIHNNVVNIAYDVQRDTFLRENGLAVIRFENKQVFENIDMVIESIRQEFASGN